MDKIGNLKNNNNCLLWFRLYITVAVSTILLKEHIQLLFECLGSVRVLLNKLIHFFSKNAIHSIIYIEKTCYNVTNISVSNYAILIFLIIKDSWKILHFHINTTGIHFPEFYSSSGHSEVKEFVSFEEIWKKFAHYIFVVRMKVQTADKKHHNNPQ